MEKDYLDSIKILEHKTDKSWKGDIIHELIKLDKRNSTKGEPRLLDIIIIHSPHVESIVLLQKSVKWWLGEIG